MKTIISIITVLYMLIAGLFNTYAPVAEDLKADPDAPAAVTLTQAQKTVLTTVFETETAYLAAMQLENGAIPMTAAINGDVTVNPYFADFAAMALLENADKYADNVKKYMEWHFDNLNTASTDYNGVDGTIYDYTVTLENGKVVAQTSKGSYDSTDSYAATFLSVVYKYYEKTSDKDYILSRADDIIRVADAMFATFSFGLTNAKPDYEVKYLMDNCEVYAGAVAGMHLLTLINDGNINSQLLLAKCKMGCELIAQNIEKSLWNADGNHYEAADSLEFSWDEYYPSATAQLFPIVYGLIDADSIRANHLYKTFCAHYDWQNFDIPDAFVWGNNALAAAMMGDVDSVMTYMANYAPKMLTHSYPLYNADIARVALAANYLLVNSK